MRKHRLLLWAALLLLACANSDHAENLAAFAPKINQPSTRLQTDRDATMVYIEGMISYVLVMIISLATGQPTRAFVEGPMSDSWCEQLIQHEGYAGREGASVRVASCLRWPDAQLQLAQSACRQTSGPGQHTRRQFECVAAQEQEQEEDAWPADRRPLARAAAPMPTTAALAASSPPEPSLGAALSDSPAPADDRAPLPEQRRIHLGTAAAALVTQAHTQLGTGHPELAEETLERALRIEPDNPLLWVELGQLWMDAGDAAQADGTSRRALALAAGDREVQASAWRLIAESLRARGRNQEAVAADRQALAVAAK
jgi:tetratricopeptide (TPR) repeat protein